MTPMIAPGRPPIERRQSTDPCTGALLNVRYHREEARTQREEQIGADRFIGADPEKDE